MLDQVAIFIERTFNVRRDELAPVLMSAVFFFCILTALMVLRPARDALGMQRGMDEIRWLFIGTAVVTLAINPVFGWLVSRYTRLSFITATYCFFSFSLLVFYGLLVFTPEAVGVVSGMVFYVWFSVFNLFVTMVFWALMADRFSLQQSKRFFALIAAGGTAGAIFGPFLAARLAAPLGTPAMLLIAIAFLLLGVVAAWSVARLQTEHHAGAALNNEAPALVSEHSVIGGSAWDGIKAILESRYLLGIASYVIIMAIMATFIYFTRLNMVAVLADDTDSRTVLLANIDFFTQLATLALQLSITGHLMRRVGVHVALILLPITVALGFIGLAVVGTMTVFILLDASFRAVQRGITRPARETLYTVVSREEKYKAKAVIDTFIYRAGDVVGAQTEGLLARLGMGIAALTMAVLPLAVLWGALGIWLGRTQARKLHKRDITGKEQTAQSESTT